MMGSENKVIKCKAAVAWEPGKPVCVEEVEVAPPKDHEVRIKMAASGVCHTDWTYLYDCEKGVKTLPFPLILGHEGSGVVESIGWGVTAVQPGDKVIPVLLPHCNECDLCLSLKTNFCTKNWSQLQQCVLADGTSRFTCRGQQVYQFAGVSTFSEYTVVPEYNVAKIDREAALDKVCLLGCGVATGYGAALTAAKVEHGSVCAVFGLGAIGLATVMGCKNSGASRIIGVDINAEKQEIAKKFGVTEFVNPNDHNKPVQEVLIEMTAGGADYTFECVGNVNLMRVAFESCKVAWGVCVIVGWTENHLMTVAPKDLVLGRTLKGSFLGGWKSVCSVPKLVEEYMSGRIMLDEFVTHTLPLEELNHAFDLMIKGKRSVGHMTTIQPIKLRIFLSSVSNVPSENVDKNINTKYIKTHLHLLLFSLSFFSFFYLSISFFFLCVCFFLFSVCLYFFTLFFFSSLTIFLLIYLFFISFYLYIFSQHSIGDKNVRFYLMTSTVTMTTASITMTTNFLHLTLSCATEPLEPLYIL